MSLSWSPSGQGDFRVADVLRWKLSIARARDGWRWSMDDGTGKVPTNRGLAPTADEAQVAAEAALVAAAGRELAALSTFLGGPVPDPVHAEAARLVAERMPGPERLAALVAERVDHVVCRRWFRKLLLRELGRRLAADYEVVLRPRDRATAAPDLVDEI